MRQKITTQASNYKKNATKYFNSNESIASIAVPCTVLGRGQKVKADPHICSIASRSPAMSRRNTTSLLLLGDDEPEDDIFSDLKGACGSHDSA